MITFVRMTLHSLRVLWMSRKDLSWLLGSIPLTMRAVNQDYNIIVSSDMMRHFYQTIHTPG